MRYPFPFASLSLQFDAISLIVELPAHASQHTDKLWWGGEAWWQDASVDLKGVSRAVNKSP